MRNYEYIIACLPDLDQDPEKNQGLHVHNILHEIRERLDGSDVDLLDLLLSGYEAENLTPAFYERAMAHRNRFIREFFTFDLNVRNAKVAYLNRALGRPEGTDVISLDAGEFMEAAAVESVLAGTDLLSREKGLDDAMWNKILQITELDIFNIDVILGFVARLKIVDRWLRLDPEKGRELFRKLVEEIRNTR